MACRQPTNVVQMLDPDKPVRLVFVLPSEHGVLFRPGYVILPVKISRQELSMVLKHLELYAVYLPLHTLVNRYPLQ